jgi:hypothetical protein
MSNLKADFEEEGEAGYVKIVKTLIKEHCPAAYCEAYHIDI